jgi:hypothetical protein
VHVTSWGRPGDASTTSLILTFDHPDEKGNSFDSLYWGVAITLLLFCLFCLIAAMVVWKRKHKYDLYDDDEGYEGEAFFLPVSQQFWPQQSQQAPTQLLPQQPPTQLLPQPHSQLHQMQTQLSPMPRSPSSGPPHVANELQANRSPSFVATPRPFQQGAWPPPE